MQNYTTERIRDVVLLSHCGAGKTSLAEAMLFSSGAINRLGRVDEGNTTSDYEPTEIKRKTSINLSLLPCHWDETKVNLIDTPGYADFLGETVAGLWVADGAIIVICATSGVEVGTEQVSRYADERSLPRLIFINKMDRDNADFYRTLEAVRSTFGGNCIPIQLPVGSQSEFRGVVDLIAMRAHIGTGGKEEDIPSSLEDQANSYSEKLVESVAEVDDELTDKYLEGEEITVEEIRRALRMATISGKVVPVLVGSALQNVGATYLLDAACKYLPSPAEGKRMVALNSLTQREEPIESSTSSALAALVFKTSADPYVGKLTYLRVYSGSIFSNSQVWNVNKGQPERIGQLFVLQGRAQEAVSQLIAGDIGVVAKLSTTTTGDTLCDREHLLTLDPIKFPSPIFSAAVYPKTKTDSDKLGSALPRLVEEDLTLHLERELDTGETVLCGMGDSHLDVVAEKIHHKFGVEVRLETPKVPYKETITIPVKAEYKHKKQTGGHGQYGHVLLELEPLPRGSGFEFAEKIVGGRIPKNYIPAVEKGVLEARQEGKLAKYPVIDVKATLLDGSYHTVDSSDISFKIAGAQAFRKGISQGHPVLLEPIVRLKVRVPESLTGDIIGDLNSKRARVLGMVPENGIQSIEAEVPLAEVQRYAIDLRSTTQGRGSYTMEPSHYEEVPPHLAQKITEERASEKSD